MKLLRGIRDILDDLVNLLGRKSISKEDYSWVKFFYQVLGVNLAFEIDWSPEYEPGYHLRIHLANCSFVCFQHLIELLIIDEFALAEKL